MTTNKEIEFKTFITKEKYDELLTSFDLKDNIFPQTNFYFDTENQDIVHSKSVLRIRQKGDKFKLTLKCHAEVGADETHIFLSKEKALDMLKNGFDASIIGCDYFVTKIAELTTHRVSTPYKNGTIFFDCSEYYGHTDYEIEYEVDSVEQGKLDFQAFLEEYKVPFKESIRKSKRAYDNKK